MFSDRDYNRNPGFNRRPSGGGFARSGGSIIMPLIIANIVVFFLQNFNPGLTDFLALDYESVTSGQIWRLGTYMFAHSTRSIFHILLNMWGLYIFGKPLENQIGGERFLKLYFVSGLIGGVIWLIFNSSPMGVNIAGEPQYPSVVGASGSVFGTMMAAAMLAPNRRYMLLFPPIPIRLKTLVTVFAVIEIYSTIGRAQGSAVAHLAHLGGLIGGYLFVVYGVRGGGRFKLWRFILEKINHLRLRRRWSQFRKTGSAKSKGRADYRDDEGDEEDDDDAGIDDILDKIGKQGLSSLTPRERRRLERARNRLKKKH